MPGGVLSRKSHEISGLREILCHTSRNQNIIFDEMLSVITWAGSADSNTGVDGARGDMYSGGMRRSIPTITETVWECTVLSSAM